MSELVAEPGTVVHVFSKPSEAELQAAIQAYLEEQDPAHEWTTARVQIVGEAYSQLNTDSKSMHEVVASLIARGLPADKASHLVYRAIDLQQALAERDGAARSKFDPVRWPEMIFWLFVAGVVFNACNS